MAEARPNANPASLPSMKRPLKVRSNPTRSSKRRKTPELKVEVERQSDWCNRSLLSCDKTASEYEQINTIYKSTNNTATLWYEECIMKCKRCQKTFNNSDTARQHEKKQKHGLCVFSRKIQYQCKICQSNVLCHRDAIDHHLTDKHGISLEDYGNSYENQQTTLAASTTITDSQNPNIKRPDKKKSDTGMKNKNDESSLCRRDAIDHQLTDKHGLSLEEYGKRYEKTLWYEQCIMKCKRCRKTYNNSDTARQHEKKQKHGLCVFFRKVQYQCKICQSNVLCCKNAINHHLTDTHGISLYDYGNNYENKLTTFSASTSITNSPSPNIKSLYKKKSDTGMQNNNDENPLCRIEGEKGKVDSEDILPTQGAQCPLSNSCLRIYNLVEYSFHLFSVHRMVDNDVSRNFLDEMKGCLRL
jgi:flagellin-specific chaperone FliS